MGSGALQKLSEASASDVQAAYKDLTAEQQANLREALAALDKGNKLSVRSMVTGEVVCSVDAKADWTYMDLLKALHVAVPAMKLQVVKICIPQEPMDEYKTLGEQNVDVKGEVQYTATDFSVGTKLEAADATPMLEEAEAGLNGLDKSAISELKALKFPPATVQLCVKAVGILLGEPCSSWEEGRKMLSDKDFLSKLVSYEKDTVSHETLNELQWYLNNPDFQKEQVRKVSAAAVCLRDWVSAICIYSTCRYRVQLP